MRKEKDESPKTIINTEPEKKSLQGRLKAMFAGLVPRSWAGWLTWLSIVEIFVLTLNVSHGKVPDLVISIGYLVPEVILMSVLLRKLKLPWSTVVAVGVTLCMYSIYFSYTTFYERTFDPKTQLEYIEYIVKNHRIPAASDCFVCHHPPMFYIGAAGFYAFFQWADLAEPIRGTQVWAHLCHLVFLLYSTLILRIFLKNPKTLALCVLLVGLWPYSIANSARAHNDVMFDATYAVGLYWIVRWFETRQFKDFVYAAGFTGFCVATKMNGLALLLTLGATLAVTLWKRDRKLSRRDLFGPLYVLPVLVAVLGVYLATREPVVNKDAKANGKADATDDVGIGQRVLGSAFNIGPSVWTGNNPSNYLYLDLKSYGEDPYVYALEDKGGRQYHFNQVLKSSINMTRGKASDGETSYAMNKAIADVLNWALLVMLGAVAIGGFTSKRSVLWKYMVLWGHAACLVTLSVGFKALIPSAYHADFRFIFPVIITGSAFLGLVLERLRARDIVLYPAVRYTTWGFMGLSALYFIPKAELSTRLTAPKGTVKKTLEELSTIVPAKTVWDKKGNTIIPNGYQLMVTPAKPVDGVTGVDITLDHNDKYEITIYSKSGERYIGVGPYTPPKYAGLAQYVEKFDDPVDGVYQIKVRPLSGDESYSVGHLLLTTTADEKKDEKK